MFQRFCSSEFSKSSILSQHGKSQSKFSIPRFSKALCNHLKYVYNILAQTPKTAP